ncbi:MAG TPA: hypothetical protein P5014_02675 [Patescibacteria group bacterium]|nr:hypothetical protein [Patescibacteria group bacterium]
MAVQKVKINSEGKKIFSLLFYIALSHLFLTCSISRKNSYDFKEIILVDLINNDSFVLEKELISNFEYDIKNKESQQKVLFVICYEIVCKTEKNDSLILKTDGINHILNDNYYITKENLLLKYWSFNEENFCKKKSIEFKQDN